MALRMGRDVLCESESHIDGMVGERYARRVREGALGGCLSLGRGLELGVVKMFQGCLVAFVGCTGDFVMRRP